MLDCFRFLLSLPALFCETQFMTDLLTDSANGRHKFPRCASGALRRFCGVCLCGLESVSFWPAGNSSVEYFASGKHLFVLESSVPSFQDGSFVFIKVLFVCSERDLDSGLLETRLTPPFLSLLFTFQSLFHLPFEMPQDLFIISTGLHQSTAEIAWKTTNKIDHTVKPVTRSRTIARPFCIL